MYELANIKKEIEHVRTHLNTAIKRGVDRENILDISRVLDKLIHEYYNIQTGKKAK